MEYAVRFHERVSADINEAYTFYENRRQGLGDDFLNALRLKTDAISAFPESFGFSNRKTYREAKISGFPFLVVFRIYQAKSEVFVASVHHERKHPSRKYR